MRIPVDTSAVSFVSAGPPEAAVDFDTKVQKTDDKGLPIIQVHLFAVGGRDPGGHHGQGGRGDQGPRPVHAGEGH
jgi:hypothetical protein